MKLRISARTLLRCVFIITHPIKSIRYLQSGSRDYSKIDINELMAYMHSPKVIIEAGAADGVDTELFATHFPDAEVYAIEPVKEQYEFLSKKFKSMDKIHLSHIALSNTDEVVKLYLGQSPGNLGGLGSSSLLEPSRHHVYFPEITFELQQNVQALTLENFITGLQITTVDLLWLDIQGKELDVLKASQKIFMERVKLVHLEISKVNLYLGIPREKEIRNFLKESGFKCVIDKVGAISGNALYLNSSLAQNQIKK
jgi:FkbM family methyltransferase